MRLIHTADWQLGARFAQFGAKAEMLRQARVHSLERALRRAQEKRVDAFVIAGDLFEDNQVAEALVDSVLDLFAQFASVPIFICPGNHDPMSGPDAVWSRRSFGRIPSNVTIFRGAQVVDYSGVCLIASPLQQKVSTVDPSLKIGDLARALPSDCIKIGITHGALAIPGKHQPNDFPIALDAATRSGLDYLAIGHWHNWQVYDNGRLVMPGTPEPDSFEQTESGVAAFVEIPAHGREPVVEKLPVANLCWRTIEFNFLNQEHSRTIAEEAIASLKPSNTVVRVVFSGSATPNTVQETKKWFDDKLADFAVTQQVDRSTTALSERELQQLQDEHPLLAEVLADLGQVERLVTGRGGTAGLNTSSVIPFTEIQRLIFDAKMDLTALRPDHFNMARQALFQKLREVQG